MRRRSIEGESTLHNARWWAWEEGKRRGQWSSRQGRLTERYLMILLMERVWTVEGEEEEEEEGSVAGYFVTCLLTAIKYYYCAAGATVDFPCAEARRWGRKLSKKQSVGKLDGKLWRWQREEGQCQIGFCGSVDLQFAGENLMASSGDGRERRGNGKLGSVGRLIYNLLEETWLWRVGILVGRLIFTAQEENLAMARWTHDRGACLECIVMGELWRGQGRRGQETQQEKIHSLKNSQSIFNPRCSSSIRKSDLLLAKFQIFPSSAPAQLPILKWAMAKSRKDGTWAMAKQEAWEVGRSP